MNDIVLQMKNMRRAVQPYVYFLYELTLESKAKNVLELGSRQMQSGRTFLSALAENGEGALTAIDLGDRSYRVSDDLKPYLRMVVGNTHDKNIYSLVADRLYDIIFIDAGHSYDDIKQDFEMYSGLLSSDGYLVLHDVCNERCGVPKFFNELRKDNNLPFEMISLDYGVAGLGIMRWKRGL